MKTKVGFKILSISDESYHLMMKVKINGKTARLVIDTGASHSAFDLKRVKKYVNAKKLVKNKEKTTGLGTNTMDSHTILLEKLKIGDITIFDYDAVILDLSHVNETYKLLKLPAIDGVLGSDVMMKLHAVIDYDKKMMTLKLTKTKK